MNEQIISIAEAKGWSVYTEEHDGVTTFEFHKFTPYGHDFSFTAEMTDNDPDTLTDDIDKYLDGYDADYEASFWIGEDGHGKKGAPYHIKDIVTDFEAAEDMTEELLEALQEVEVLEFEYA